MGLPLMHRAPAGHRSLFRVQALAGSALLVSCSWLPAETTVVLETPLLPDHFAAWSPAASSTAPAGAAANLPLLEDATLAAIAKEDGLTRTASVAYTRPGRAGEVSVQAIQFTDATGAVAAYTYLRHGGMTERAGESGIRNHTNVAVGEGKTLLREGTSLVVINSTDALSAEDLRALSNSLPKVSGPKGFPPLLPTYLPAEGETAGSVRYAVGPAAYKAEGGVLPPELIGFDKAAEAATADYTGRAGSGKLTLLLLPTPQIAGDRGRALEGWLNTPEAKSLGTVKLRRIGPMLALATGGFTPDQAKAMVDGIHLRTELTWNKPVPPEFHVEVRKTASLLTSILVFSGVGALAAILLGAFLGFGRAWVRVLMGKPAATEPEFLRLDLRSGTPAEK